MSWSCLHSQIHSPSKAFILHLIQSSDQSIFSLPSHFWPHLIHFFTHRIITISSMSWSHTESMSFLHGTVYLICSILILFDCFISSGWFLSLSSYWIEKTELLQLHFQETHSMCFFRPKRKRPTTVPHTVLHKLFSVVFSESWHPQKKSHHFRANVEMSKPSFSSKQKPTEVPVGFKF